MRLRYTVRLVECKASILSGSLHGTSTEGDTHMERRRVVVTGMGIICPVGKTVAESWRNACQGISGVSNITRVNTSDIPVHFGGEVKDFDAKAEFGHREARRMDRVTQFAMAAARDAVRYSCLQEEN